MWDVLLNKLWVPLKIKRSCNNWQIDIEKEVFPGRSKARDQPELPTTHMLPSKQVPTQAPSSILVVVAVIGKEGEKQNEGQPPPVFNILCQTRWNCLWTQLFDDCIEMMAKFDFGCYMYKFIIARQLRRHCESTRQRGESSRWENSIVSCSTGRSLSFLFKFRYWSSRPGLVDHPDIRDTI